MECHQAESSSWVAPYREKVACPLFSTRELTYELPRTLIAQHPSPRRDDSRLMVLHRADGRIEHGNFRSLESLLSPRDVLVLNDTRVIPAKLLGRRETSGRVEVIMVREVQEDTWEVLFKSRRRPKLEEKVFLENGEVGAVVRGKGEDGTWVLEFLPPGVIRDFMKHRGRAPLPPYIKRDAAGDHREEDLERYQTVYARDPGAIAAPTAGLHFTDELLDGLRSRGVRIAFLTLHVGMGTFKPIESDVVGEHDMLPEFYRVPRVTIDMIACARHCGGRVAAVGTSVVRTLETIARLPAEGASLPSSMLQGPGSRVQAPESGLQSGEPAHIEGWTSLFIVPPFEFRVVDALVTNFHLPASTNLALVSAFAGTQRILDAYREAIGRGYRFYSYGDAMIIA